MSDDKNKVLLKILDAQQKQLENSQQQVSTLTKELVKLSTLIEKTDK